MNALTEDGTRMVASMASQHGFSQDTVEQLLAALSAGGGRQAQFNIRELGGMGQWSQGGMTMIGDMFNSGLKGRVAALCNDLATALQGASPFQSSDRQHVCGTHDGRWPAELGSPSSAGSQNDQHYAVFPDSHRLAIEQSGRVTVYDTGDHRIGGVSQQQGGDQSLRFTSQSGVVSLTDLAIVSGAPDKVTSPAEDPAPTGQIVQDASEPDRGAPEPDKAAAAPATPTSASDDEIFSRLERLADLRNREIISGEEFAAKKTDLLSRL